MNLSKILLLLLLILITFGLIAPNGLRSAIANNLWSIKFVRANEDQTPPTSEVSPPPATHPHAGLLLAHHALQQNDINLANIVLQPLVEESEPLALDTYAEIQYLQGNYEKSIEVWGYLGDFKKLEYAAGDLASKGELDLVILAFQNAYKIRPKAYAKGLVIYKMQKVLPLMQSQHYEEAIEAYQNLINEFPDIGRPYTNLALAYMQNQQPEQALDVIEKGWLLNQDYPYFYVVAAEIYTQNGNIEKAINAYQTALNINPKYEQAKISLEKLLGSN